MRHIATCIIMSLIASTATAGLTDYVEPRIGTAPSVTHTAGMFGRNTEELGQTLPAVLEPHGMNFWTPQTRDTERKCVAPYYYTDSLLQGFRCSHWIVGGCTQDYGSMTLSTLSGTLRLSPTARATRIERGSEISRPDYYSVTLPGEGIKAEMTGRSRSAIFRFTYFNGGKGYLVINPNSDEGEGSIAIDIKNRRITGNNPVHRIYQGKGESAGFAGHFVVEWDKSLKVTGYGTYEKGMTYPGETSRSWHPAIGAYIEFDVTQGETVTVKVASSFTGLQGAIANLNAEIPHFDFDKTRNELHNIWERHLGKIKVTGGSDPDKRKFYSALYRSSFLPRTFNDVDGSYPAFAGGKSIEKAPEGHDYYEDYSVWDTYRAQHPLLTILSPTRSGDMMRSLIDKYEQGGWLPIFPCWNSYTAAMIGDHCIATISDAIVKGIGGFDIDKAYEAMRKNAFVSPVDEKDYRDGMGRRALKSYLKYGYVPLEDSVPYAYHRREQVSRTLEYAFDDFALSMVAKKLGRDSDYRELSRRAMNYRNVIDPATGYARGRHASGQWATPFNPVAFDKSITEGAPCHYTWYVPHDQHGLMEAMGGREAYISRLDSMFSHGRYWHGNEPCHQVAWLYNYVGEPWKTQYNVRHIMETEYLDCPGGLSGNDDAGQMSSWYIFAAMGFYPVCPATPYYVLGSPVFPRMEINMENGKKFTVIARDASPENIYIKSAMLNGKPYDKNYITHDDITNGSTLEFEMSATPSMTRGRSPESSPPTIK